ncbi:MAG: T9SS type A sorting domain-containing protein [Ferruginibacter sp.]|nr:T9SS type A sorting domain-containing protein [Ferruginibacter sp.]
MKTLFLKGCLNSLAAILYISATAQPVNFEWVRTVGNADYETVVSMVIDSNKSVITAGTFSTGTVDFDPGPAVFNLTSNGSFDIFIMELDTAGAFQWAKQIGGSEGDEIDGMAKDSAGNLYLTGYFVGTVDFDPGPAVNNLISTTFLNNFILKLDNNGNFIWAKQFSPNSTDNIHVDAAGNVYITGDFAGTVDFDPGPAVVNLSSAGFTIQDGYILKLDNNGNFIWVKQLKETTGTMRVRFIQTDVSGNMYASGDFTATVDFDPNTGVSNLTSFGMTDGYILKLDAAGNFIWVKQLGGAEGSVPVSLELDATGNIFSSGNYLGTMDADPGPGTQILPGIAGNSNTFIIKLDNNGNFIFGKYFFNSTFGVGNSFMTLDRSSSLYLVGYTALGTDFDPGPAVFNMPGGSYLVKLDSSGNFAWGAGFNPCNVNYRYVVATDILKNVYTAGAFACETDFDPGSPIFNVTDNGGNDAFILKLRQCNNSLKTINATSCSRYVLNGITYPASGQYIQTLTNAVGCDSIIVLNLTVTAINTTINATICEGSLYGVYGVSGTFTDTYTTPLGCDSTRILNLEVKSRPHPDLGGDTTICKTSFVLSPGAFRSYLWSDGTIGSNLAVTGPGIYWVTVTNTDNCPARDSITVLPAQNCSTAGECIVNVEIQLYPMPFRDILVIKKNTADCIIYMNLYNAAGQLLIRNQLIVDGENQISLHSLPAGMYFYKFYAKGRTLKTGKIIKA